MLEIVGVAEQMIKHKALERGVGKGTVQGKDVALYEWPEALIEHGCVVKHVDDAVRAVHREAEAAGLVQRHAQREPARILTSF